MTDTRNLASVPAETSGNVVSVYEPHDSIMHTDGRTEYLPCTAVTAHYSAAGGGFWDFQGLTLADGTYYPNEPR